MKWPVTSWEIHRDNPSFFQLLKAISLLWKNQNMQHTIWTRVQAPGLARMGMPICGFAIRQIPQI